MKISILAALAVLGLSGASMAKEAAIKDTSYKDAAGNRVQQLQMDVDAERADVWAAFATDGGYTKWAVPVAHIDLRNDGIIETSYNLDAKIGDPNNIKSRIVAYLPMRFIATQVVNVPPGAPFDPVLIGGLRHVAELTDLGRGKTRITFSGVGYGEGEGHERMYDLFLRGNTAELRSLAQALSGEPTDWVERTRRLQQSVEDRAQ